MLSIAPTPSPCIHPNINPYHPRPRHETRHERQNHTVQTPVAPPTRQRQHYPSPPTAYRRRTSSYSPAARPRMVNAGTQWSPPKPPSSEKSTLEDPPPTSSTIIAGLKIADKDQSSQSSDDSSSEDSQPAEPLEPAATARPDSRGKAARSVSQAHAKRQADGSDHERSGGTVDHGQESDDSPMKKAKPEAPAVRILPQQYELCDTRDLVILISSMLMELIRYNDAIPLKDGHLTRFHSRAPPGISVQDYLQRLTTHATLSPPILLSMVYYIDRLCAMYPAFTITSLTVHRFLIASATVASKGLSDSFWTNKTYARVGGVSIKELALLELEFVTRVDWRIVPKPEVLCDYYVSLVKRSDTHKLEHADEEGGTG